MKTLGLVMAILGAISVRGAQPDWKHVREDARLTPLSASVRNCNHVLFVNVADALDARTFAAAVAHAATRIQVNMWTNTLPRSLTRAALDDATLVGRTFGGKAKLVVFFERSAKGPLMLSVPGAWASVNVREVYAGNPDEQTRRDRAAKMVLKGLGLVAGVATSPDRECALYGDSLEAAKLDKVNIMIAQMAYFPIMASLQQFGGDEIVTPPAE